MFEQLCLHFINFLLAFIELPTLMDILKRQYPSFNYEYSFNSFDLLISCSIIFGGCFRFTIYSRYHFPKYRIVIKSKCRAVMGRGRWNFITFSEILHDLYIYQNTNPPYHPMNNKWMLDFRIVPYQGKSFIR